MENIYNFLNDLKRNNNREWFNENKDRYELAREEANAIFSSIAEELNRIDDFSPYKLYRIYRDVRFSKDKTPYKGHFAALFSRRQPNNRGSFYLQLKPEGSMIGGGFWSPNKEDLLSIRKAIEMEDELKTILNNKELKALVGSMDGEQLKTVPQGFDINHPRIELLRYKQFLLRRPLTDEEVFSTEFKDMVVKTYQTMQPFFEYMTDVLTTDENGESLIK